MNETLRKSAVYSSLGLAIAWAAVNYSPSKTDFRPADATGERKAVIASVPAISPLPTPVVEGTKSVAWGNDPFHTVTLNHPKTKIPTSKSRPWRLSAIVYNEARSMALINNRSVSVGDSIDGATVKRINRRSVEIDRNGKQHILKVSKG